MKNRTERVKIFFYIAILIGAVLIFTAPFWHIDLPDERNEITELRRNLEKKEESFKLRLEQLRRSHLKGTLSSEHFLNKSILEQEKLDKLQKHNEAILANAIDAQRVFSWKSPRSFLLALGIRLPYVFFSLIISLLILDRKEKSRNLNYAFSFLMIACWSISSYLMIWVFWDFQDYPLEVYRYAFIASSILIGTAISFFIANHESTSSILKSKIRYIMNLMINQAIDKGHIKDQDRYEDEIIFPALKKLDE